MLNGRDFDWICETLKLSRSEIVSVRPNPCSGRNNGTFILETVRGPVLYRVAGRGTERFCSREREKSAYERLKGRGLTDELLGCDPASGAKLAVYYPDCRTCDPHDPRDRGRAAELLRRFHSQAVVLEERDNLYRRLEEYVRVAEEAGGDLIHRSDFLRARAGVDAIREEFDCPEAELRPVHADAQAGNFLFRPDGTALLIDLEFAAMGCPYGDLADFCHGGGLSQKECGALLADYLRRVPREAEMSKLYAYCACAALMWSAWAAYKARAERDRARLFEDYRDRSVDYALKCLDLCARRG